MTLEGDDVSALDAMFESMYTFKYDTAYELPATFHFKVFVTADKYMIPDLKDFAKTMFEESLANWNTEIFWKLSRKPTTGLKAIWGCGRWF